MCTVLLPPGVNPIAVNNNNNNKWVKQSNYRPIDALRVPGD
jgi:hypothetical protein